MRTHPVLALLAFLALLAAAPAPASTPNTGSAPWDSQDEPVPVAVTRSVKLLIKEIPEQGRLVLVDEAEGTAHNLSIDESVALRAQSKKDFDGRKKLVFDDLEVGQRVKLTFRTDTGKIVEIRVLSDTEPA